MKRRRLIRPIHQPSSAFSGFRFPPEVILIAVRWYLRYGLSYRDLEELLAERGIEVDHVTLFRWVQRFTPILVSATGPCRHGVSDRWFVDETYGVSAHSFHVGVHPFSRLLAFSLVEPGRQGMKDGDGQVLPLYLDSGARPVTSR